MPRLSPKVPREKGLVRAKQHKQRSVLINYSENPLVPDDDLPDRLIQSRFKLIFNFQYGGEADERI